MRVLIVEDQEAKLQAVLETIVSWRADCEIHIARSLRAGQEKLTGETFDVAVLDMTLRVFDESSWGDLRNRSLGGRLLLEVVRAVGSTPAVIVVTQFDSFQHEGGEVTLDELTALLQEEFNPEFVGLVQYSVFGEEWRHHLVRLLEEQEL